MKDIDRLYRYKSLLLSRHAVPTEELMSALGISIATLKRDLAQLRERLHIPVVYDRLLGGYRLEAGHGKRELPGLWLSSEELVALATLQQLLANFAPGVLSDKLAPLKERLAGLLHDIDLDALGLAQRIRVVHAGQRRLPPAAFETVAAATLARQRLRLWHHRRESGETLEREVSPQQLVHYRDNWYLDAWCHLRNGLRSFAVDAIQRCQPLDEAAHEMDPEALKTATQSSYGIFSGTPKARATLRFSPVRARWVSGEQWHPEQTGEWTADGHYLLELPYSDERELVGDILRHGAGCEVLAPPALREHVKKALKQSLKAYRD
ncbi:MAG TPA: YafY family protein [Macromonas sp.]|nr:YafY family protein [Macromonas sp.]